MQSYRPAPPRQNRQASNTTFSRFLRRDRQSVDQCGVPKTQGAVRAYSSLSSTPCFNVRPEGEADAKEFKSAAHQTGLADGARCSNKSGQNFPRQLFMSKAEAGGDTLAPRRTALRHRGVPLRVLVPRKLTGHIVGARGSTLRRLASESAANIEIVRGRQTPSFRHQIVTINGPSEKAKTIALLSILRVMQAKQQGVFDIHESVTKLEFIVPDVALPSMMGAYGGCLAHILNTTRCTLEVPADESPVVSGGHVDRVVAISASDLGSLARCMVAVNTLLTAMHRLGLLVDADLDFACRKAPLVTSFVGPFRNQTAVGKVRRDGGQRLPLRKNPTCRILIDKFQASWIIGVKGQNKRDFESWFGVRLWLRNEVDDYLVDTMDDRLLEIQGEIEAVLAAMKTLLRSFEEKVETRAAAAASWTQLRIAVPANSVGFIMGHGGSTIMGVQKDSGAHVQVVKNPPVAGISLRLLRVEGAFETRVGAAELIVRLLQEWSSGEKKRMSLTPIPKGASSSDTNWDASSVFTEGATVENTTSGKQPSSDTKGVQRSPPVSDALTGDEETLRNSSETRISQPSSCPGSEARRSECGPLKGAATNRSSSGLSYDRGALVDTGDVARSPKYFATGVDDWEGSGVFPPYVGARKLGSYRSGELCEMDTDTPQDGTSEGPWLNKRLVAVQKVPASTENQGCCRSCEIETSGSSTDGDGRWLEAGHFYCANFDDSVPCHESLAMLEPTPHCVTPANVKLLPGRSGGIVRSAAEALSAGAARLSNASHVDDPNAQIDLCATKLQKRPPLRVSGLLRSCSYAAVNRRAFASDTSCSDRQTLLVGPAACGDLNPQPCVTNEPPNAERNRNRPLRRNAANAAHLATSGASASNNLDRKSRGSSGRRCPRGEDSRTSTCFATFATTPQSDCPSATHFGRRTASPSRTSRQSSDLDVGTAAADLQAPTCTVEVAFPAEYSQVLSEFVAFPMLKKTIAAHTGASIRVVPSDDGKLRVQITGSAVSCTWGQLMIHESVRELQGFSANSNPALPSS